MSPTCHLSTLLHRCLSAVFAITGAAGAPSDVAKAPAAIAKSALYDDSNRKFDLAQLPFFAFGGASSQRICLLIVRLCTRPTPQLGYGLIDDSLTIPLSIFMAQTQLPVLWSRALCLLLQHVLRSIKAEAYGEATNALLALFSLRWSPCMQTLQHVRVSSFSGFNTIGSASSSASDATASGWASASSLSENALPHAVQISDLIGSVVNQVILRQFLVFYHPINRIRHCINLLPL